MSLVFLVTRGTAGDILQMIGLAEGLRARAHDVVLMTHAPYAERVAAAGAEFVPLDTDEQYERHLAYTPDLLNLRSPRALREFYDRNGLFAQLRAEIAEMAARHRPGDTVLVGRHGSALSVLIAAELLGAPAAWVALYPSQLITAEVGAHFLMRGLGDDLDHIRAEFGLGPVPDRRAWPRSAGLTLALWPRWFDDAGIRAPADTHLAGFIPGDDAETGSADDAELPGTQRPAVLVTGGTGRMLHAEFYPAALAAVAAAGCTAVVVTPHRDLLPERLPEGVRWVPRVPFTAALPRFDAVVHHGGIGTAMRAMRAGTPQLILAHGLDRPDNAARLAARGLAEWAGPADWAPATTGDLLRRALDDSGFGDRAAAQLADDDPAVAVRRAGEALEALVATDSGRHVAGSTDGATR
ncbi:glycosyltransferase [Plantactinospora sp. CA-290183]|uniref:glycosyltransferase n=1 Tax=Plantactinospora sp. CA-290183 TaxID=3240006 RepID=UPI003D8F722C